MKASIDPIAVALRTSARPSEERPAPAGRSFMRRTITDVMAKLDIWTDWTSLAASTVQMRSLEQHVRVHWEWRGHGFEVPLRGDVRGCASGTYRHGDRGSDLRRRGIRHAVR